ncbi:MAG: DUF58 domain-containing protein [Kiritimatiellae bacterium]|nr:DUF58 domain-containing protein [Kiritimatiellia bacterium]
MTDKADYMRLLPGDSLKAIGRLELLARTPKEGFVTGRHRSPNKGFSVEFAEHRPYSAGDDLRNLDWRVLGRTDRLYVKEFVEETNMRATILVDASGSMGYAGEAAAKRNDRCLSKFEYAQHLAAALTYLLINQQDAVASVVFDSAIRSYIPARARPSQLRIVLDDLASRKPGDDTDLAGVFHDIAERIPRRGMVIIVSDLFDDPRRLVQALHHFRHRHHEVLLFHVMAEEELTFPFNGFLEFRDLENAENRIPLDPRAIRASYLDQVRAFLKIISTECGRLSIDYVPMNTRRPYEEALAEYLRNRRAPRA